VIRDCREKLAIPALAVNARDIEEEDRQKIIQAMTEAKMLTKEIKGDFYSGDWPEVEPRFTLLDHPVWGPWLALGALFLLFALPVWMAYRFASWVQPFVDGVWIDPLRQWTANVPGWLKVLLTGDYGLFTLGSYSFLWSFPVVVLIGLSVAVTEEIGLKDRITDALDPCLRKVGLNGRDLVPVLTGFGCNVVAVFQSRTCSACTRKSCVSLISFGSACSYQIGATLSLFGSAHAPWLVFPYLSLLFLTGVIHNRLWYGGGLPHHELPRPRAFLQHPTWKGVRWRLKAVVSQFMLQAMPIFLLICLVASFLEYVGAMRVLTSFVSPLIRFFHLPDETAAGLIFSIIRKDGMLILNQGYGTLLSSLSLSQLFLVVWLASTMTACLVTLWTVRKEMGWKTVFELASKQLVTSLASGCVILACIVIWKMF